MDPNTILDIFSGLDIPVMASLAVLAGILRVTRLPILACLAIPMVLGGVWGYLVTLDEVDMLTGGASKMFSAVLLNGMGAVVIGRLAAPVVQKLFNIDPKDKPPA